LINFNADRTGQFAGWSSKEVHMIDHIYLPVTDIDRSLEFYGAVLTPLGFAHRWDFKAQAGWPDLYGFGGDSPGFWLKKSSSEETAMSPALLTCDSVQRHSSPETV
jgi:hypothetical protein